MKDFFKRLQLASSVPIHSFVLGIHLVDPIVLPHCQEHGVLIPDLLKDGHGHVGHLVPGAIDVGTKSLFQDGPGLAISPRLMNVSTVASIVLSTVVSIFLMDSSNMKLPAHVG